MELLLFFFVTFLQLTVGIIASLTNIKTNENKPFPLNLTFAGWVLMISFVACIGFSVALFLFSEGKREKSEAQALINDSLHQKHIDSIQYNTIELLAKYGLKIDSNKSEIIQVLRDSIRTKTIIINEKNPLINFCDQSVRLIDYVEDSVNFQIGLCTAFSPAKKVNVKVYCVVFNNGKFILPQGEIFAFNNDTMEPDKVYDVKINIMGFRNVNQFIFVAVGSYYNSDLSKKFQLLESVAYLINTKRIGNLIGEHQSELFRFLKSKGIKLEN